MTEKYNMSMRKFLKQVGVTSQQAIEEALRKADATKPIALICRTGNRSGRVIQILAKQGFPGLVDVAEGVAGGPRGKGWKPRGLPTYKADITEIMTRRDKVLP